MRTSSFIFIFMLSVQVFSQTNSDTTYWKKGANLGINFNQASLSNWAAGGGNSFSWASYFGAFMDYRKGNVFWRNMIDTGIGWVNEKNSPAQKSEDKIHLNSIFGYRIEKHKKLFTTFSIDFRTQFTKGFAEDDLQRSNYISRFLAPGYVKLSAGIGWNASQAVKANIGILSNKNTIVLDDYLSNTGSFGLDTGRILRSEFGATLVLVFEDEIFRNIDLSSRITLFTNYLESPEKVDVNWENSLTMKINNVVSAHVFTQIVYDYDIKFDVIDDNGTITGLEEKIQFKNITSFGLAFRLGQTRTKFKDVKFD